MAPPIVVVGSSLPGLLAGALLARRGASVTLVEAAPTEGADPAPVPGLEELPVGSVRWPLHPVVDGMRSPLVPLLSELHLPAPHPVPGTWPRYFEHGGRLSLAPLNPLSLMRSPFLSGRGKRHYLTLLFSALRAKLPEVQGERLDQWMERVEFDEEARGFLRDVAPAVSWCADVDDLDAAPFLSSLQEAFRSRYRVARVPGGWAGLAAALAALITRAGGRVDPGLQATAVLTEGDRARALRLADGTELPLSGLVIATSLEAAAVLTKGSPLEPETTPAAAAEGAGGLVLTLTLRAPALPASLSSLYDTSRRFLVQEVPLEEWSPGALLQEAGLPADPVAPPTPPEGGQRLQCIAFLRGRHLRSPAHARGAREGLHALLDAHAPGWRGHLVAEHAALHPRLVPVRPRVGLPATAYLPLRSAHLRNVAFASDAAGAPGRLGNAGVESAR
ncbi:MAG TPA: FAD-dependent oxidoreductase, partial [Candidatus Thermoplasmatota archaeon]|nr:FAD-dependent oxidoreductase [Candidatus Thermoplasmatota archaeon]